MGSLRRTALTGTPSVERLLSKEIAIPILNNEFFKCGSFTFYRNRVECIVVLSLICFLAFMVFSSLHFDYDKNLDRLSSYERSKLSGYASEIKEKAKLRRLTKRSTSRN